MRASIPSTPLLREYGHLGPSRARTFLAFPLDVPIGTGSLVLRLTFVPDRVASLRNLVTLTVFDPDGFRGAAHRHDPDQRVVISRKEASPGFLRGTIQAGTWTVELDLHAVLPSLRGGLDYTLEVDAVAGE